jgi:hypothetical protein
MWHDTHTQIGLSDTGQLEIHDLDLDPATFTSKPEKLYGLLIVRPVVGYASFEEASQVGRHLAKGGLSMKDLIVTDAVTLPTNTLVAQVVEGQTPKAGSQEERGAGMASQYLVTSGPYKKLLVWIPALVEISAAPFVDCTVPEIRQEHRACKPTSPYGKPNM